MKSWNNYRICRYRVASLGAIVLTLGTWWGPNCSGSASQTNSQTQSATIADNDVKQAKNPRVKNAQEKAAQARRATQAANSPLQQIKDVDGLPRVLLIGDSISIGYTLDVRRQLEGKANVHRPPTNCGPTSNGIKSIEEWLKVGGQEKRWDVIHFNWGLHDLKYMGPNGENLADPKLTTSHRQISPEDYEKNLRELVQRLKATGATLIWRNTTPVPEGAKGRVPGDELLYNEIAAKVMKEFEVPTHDLYAFAKQHGDKIQRKADVHYTPEGCEQLAQQVTEAILKIGLKK